METPDKEIAARAKEAMERAGIPNNKLAKQVGRSQATVSDYLNGSIRIPVSVLVVIAKLTGFSLERLATGKEALHIASNTTKGSIVREHTDAWKVIGDPPSDFEQRIISMLRRLPADRRQAFTDLITTAYVDHMENQ